MTLDVLVDSFLSHLEKCGTERVKGIVFVDVEFRIVVDLCSRESLLPLHVVNVYVYNVD